MITVANKTTNIIITVYRTGIIAFFADTVGFISAKEAADIASTDDRTGVVAAFNIVFRASAAVVEKADQAANVWVTSAVNRAGVVAIFKPNSVICGTRQTADTVIIVLFIGTGALMNTMSLNQGQTIPGIAHLVRIRATPKSEIKKREDQII